MKKLLVLFLMMSLVCVGFAGQKDGIDAKLEKEMKASITKGLDYLVKSVKKDGGWGDRPNKPGHPGVTAICLTAFFESPEGDAIRKALAENGKHKYAPTVKKGMEYLKTFVKKDGGIYQKGTPNYITSVALLAFVAAKDKQYDTIIKNAQNFLLGLQCDEDKGYEKKDRFYGGIGYGGDERPDLSNTQFALEALKKSGLKKDHPAFKKALTFLQRCQNNSETNDLPKISNQKIKIKNDGGGYYSPDVESEKSGKQENADGTFSMHSYGSMTYALAKSMIYCGLTKDDPRLKAAINWIKNNYTVDENPNMGQKSLYYYYTTFSKALDVLEDDVVVDKKGVKHFWRADIAKKIITLQKADGSWVNAEDRWWEGDPSLVTAYVLLSFGNAIK